MFLQLESIKTNANVAEWSLIGSLTSNVGISFKRSSAI